MKNRLTIVLMMVLFLMQACNNKDCEGYSCFTPPRAFVFEIVDKDTGENLFTNGTYLPEQIAVLNADDDSMREFGFMDEDDINLISIYSIGWETEIADVVLKIAGENILNLYVDVERVSENCCNFSTYNRISIENASFEFDQQSDIYTIYVQQ